MARKLAMIKVKSYKYFYNISMLLLAFLAYTAYASDKNVEDKVQACMDFEPKIIICGRSLVSETRVVSALRTWERLGYSFSEIEYDESEECPDSDEYGVFIITEPNESFDKKYLATTKRLTVKFRDEDFIVQSKIYISNRETRKERVLEHEIGHAIGWDHFNVRYHLMHENWNEGGHTNSGLNKRNYDKKCSK